MPDQVASVREGYDRWASVYDHDANPLTALEETYMQTAVGNPQEMTVLDLGCGTGRHTAWLAAAGARVTAIDFSPEMLAVARRKTSGVDVTFLTHDLHETLPLPQEAFDLVVSGLVLEHLRNLEGFFAEAHRVLRPGGRAVVSAMHPAMFLRGSQARFTDPMSGEVVQPGSLPHQLGDFVMAAVRAGFAMEDIGEYAPDASFAERYPRAEKCVGWPMLVLLQMQAKSNPLNKPTQPTFRSATVADAEAVSEVYLISRKMLVPWAPTAHSDSAVRAWIRDHLIPTGRVTIAIQDDDVIGMMALSNNETAGWIEQLYLHPRAVGLGIGSALLARAKTELGPPIRLYTFQASEGARRFYERHSFQAIAESDGSDNEEQCPDVLYEWRG